MEKEAMYMIQWKMHHLEIDRKENANTGKWQKNHALEKDKKYGIDRMENSYHGK